jgi:hypothetical protein
MSPSQRVEAAAETVRLIVDADRRRLEAKLARLDARVLAGDLHLSRHRDSLRRQLRATGRKAGEQR